MVRHLAPIALLLAASPALAWGERCEFSAQREVTLDAKALQQLGVIAAAGDLTIRGEPGLTRITATGTACASSQALLDGIQLTAGGGDGPEGDGSVLRVVTPEASWSWGDNYAYLDLQVRVPGTLALDVQDSSGDVEVEDVAALTVRDSSGDIEIRDIAGLVRVADSSGDIDVRNAGSVVVDDDSSGDIELSDIGGDARIERDSSGDIDLADIQGNAMVEVDSSGDIEFSRIKGSAKVDRDSSGGIRADDVGGDFVVRIDGSGGIHHHGVAGRVDIPEDD
jgi:hypothetical protein